MNVVARARSLQSFVVKKKKQKPNSIYCARIPAPHTDRHPNKYRNYSVESTGTYDRSNNKWGMSLSRTHIHGQEYDDKSKYAHFAIGKCLLIEIALAAGRKRNKMGRCATMIVKCANIKHVSHKNMQIKYLNKFLLSVVVGRSRWRTIVVKLISI